MMINLTFCRLLTVFLLLLHTAASAQPAQHELRVTVDWTKATGKVNRPLFSLQGFMQIYAQPNPMVMETFTLLNPKGTQTRLETWIHQMEPANDNDDPETFAWERLNRDEMIRFIDDLGAFQETLDRLGMEPLALLCYDVE